MALDTKAHLFRLARGLFPVIVFLATLIVGIKLGAFDDSLAGYVTSPLQAIFGLGLPLFSGSTFMIFQGLLNQVMAEKSKSWPTVNGEVIESDAAPTFIGLYIWLWWPLIRFRYIVNGKLYEKNSWQFGRSNFGSIERAEKIASQFPVGTKVHVRFDPLDPEIAVFDCGDDAARRGIWVGASLLAAPFALCLPVVWWNQLS
jgi:Protein of unknown function (DUF3592)